MCPPTGNTRSSQGAIARDPQPGFCSLISQLGHASKIQDRFLKMSSPGRETTQQEQKQVSENEFPRQGDYTAGTKQVSENEFPGRETTQQERTRFLKMSSPSRETTQQEQTHVSSDAKTFIRRLDFHQTTRLSSDDKTVIRRLD